MVTKKTIIFLAGIVLVLAGIAPVLAQSQTSDTNVDIQNNISLAISGTAPYGTGGNTYQLTPLSGTTSTVQRAGEAVALPSSGNTATSTLTMTTNSVNGGTITANGDDNGGTSENAGTIYSASNDEEITNTGGGATLAVTCLAAENNTSFEGLALRVVVTGTHADYEYDGSTTIATKYGADTNATSRLWCHLDSTSRNLALTELFDDPDNGGRDAIVDYFIGVKAGSVTAGSDYTELITFTASAN